MQTFNTTISLISIDKKLWHENYPTIVYQDENLILTEAQARFKVLNNSWITVENIDLNTFLNLIIKKSHSFCPAQFKPNNQNNKGIAYTTNFNKKGNRFFAKDIILYSEKYPKSKHIWRSKNSFQSLQLICIDIDSGYNSVEEIKQTNFDSSLKDCSYIYSSLSFDEEQNKIKVRVGWLLNEPIFDIKEAEFCLLNVTKYFKADEACKDGSRLYFNGKEVLYKNNKIIFDKSLFINHLNIASTPLNNFPQTQNKNILYNECGILINGVQSKVSFTQEEFKLKMINLGYTYYNDNKNNNYIIRNFNFEYAIDNNLSLIKFCNEHLKYSDLFKLAINLNMIEGGLKFMNEVMNDNNLNSISHYNNSDFEIINSVRKYNYVPESIYFFSDCKQLPDYYVKQIKTNKQMITLNEAELKLKEFYRQAMSSNDNNIHIII